MIRKLWHDESGQALILVTVMLSSMLGMVGLAIDASRFMSMHSQLQDLADAAALAGAKQLDGNSDAITRATTAAEAMSQLNNPWLSNVASSGVQIQDPPIFYRVLKGDLDPTTNQTATADVTTTDATEANYIKVTTVTRSVDPILLVAIGLSREGATATATANSTYVACNVQPLMLCNPNYPSDFSANAGDLYGFTVNGNAPASTGAFSLVDPPGQTNASAPDITKLLSASTPRFCYTDNLSPDTGNKAQAVAAGINARFDIQPNGKNGPNYAGADWTPDVNTIKGDATNACLNSGNPTNGNGNGNGNGNAGVTTTSQLPGAAALTTTAGGTVIGTSMDSTGASSYMTAHHSSTGTWPSGWTRYKMYQQELAGSIAFNSGSETMQHTPNTCAGITAKTGRRLISVAIVNCSASNPIHGNSIPFVQSHTYAQFFLTRPVDTSSNIIWAEFVQMITPNTAGAQVKQVVQLVRDY